MSWAVIFNTSTNITTGLPAAFNVAINPRSNTLFFPDGTSSISTGILKSAPAKKEGASEQLQYRAKYSNENIQKTSNGFTHPQKNGPAQPAQKKKWMQ